MNEVINDLNALKFENRIRIWKPFMEKYNCQVIAEIGVREGYNFERMIEHNPKEAVAIDIWKDDGIIARNDVAFSQSVLNMQYADFNSRVIDKKFVTIIREYSFDA